MNQGAGGGKVFEYFVRIDHSCSRAPLECWVVHSLPYGDTETRQAHHWCTVDPEDKHKAPGFLGVGVS